LSHALFTDLYELTMAEAYLAAGCTGRATFELYFRHLPPRRGYAIACGLDDALTWLEGLRFAPEDLDYLRGLGIFGDRLFAELERLRFTGDVWAVPEGTLIFGNEPILRVEAPIVEAQLAETWLLNQIHVQTVIATKAARVVEAARGRTVVEFGARRAHGHDAAMKVARATWLAGFAGTSLVEAGQRWGIPVYGTMAHSFVQAFGDERRAFERFATVHPGSTLLVDTWDTREGVRLVAELATRAKDPLRVGAIRIDSGDLGAEAREARRILDEAGLTGVRIIASSDLDEWRVAELVESGAPIDGFGVGTRLVVSEDAPSLGVVYKLVAYEGEGRIKLSPTKVLYPGPKQIFRQAEGGVLAGDVVGRADEELPGARLLVPVMRQGRRLDPPEPLEAIRARIRAGLDALPTRLRALDPGGPPYPVRHSEALRADLEAARAALEPAHAAS